MAYLPSNAAVCSYLGGVALESVYWFTGRKLSGGYLGRDVTTVQRRERRQGMPIHRHKHDKRGSAYTLRSETILDSELSVVCPDNASIDCGKAR